MTPNTKILFKILSNLIVSFSLFFHSTTNVVANVYANETKYQEEVERLLKALDSDSFAKISFSYNEKESTLVLPGTSLEFGQNSSKFDDGSLELREIKVEVYTRYSKTSELQSLVKQLLEKYSSSVVVVIKNLPEKYVPPYLENKAQTQTQTPQEKKQPDPVQQAPSGFGGEQRDPNKLTLFEKRMLDISDKVSKSIDSMNPTKMFSTKSLEKFGIVSASIGGFLVVLFLLVFFLAIREIKKLNSGINSSIAGAADKLGSLTSSEGGFGEGKEALSSSASSTGSSVLTFEDSVFLQKKLGDFSNASVESVLFDCYWTGADDYASWFMSGLPINRRGEILRRKAMRDYASYLAIFPRNPNFKDFKVLDDPYYFLSPIDISEIDQKGILSIIDDFPWFYGCLSKIRKELLDISPLRRITLEKAYTEHKVLVSEEKATNDIDFSQSYINSTIDFSNYKAEDERVLPTGEAMLSKSVSDDEELLQNIDMVSTSDMKRITTLVWLMKLPLSQLTELFSPYSAKALSRIWTAPETVLKHLEESLDEEKRDLLNFYLEKNPASRFDPLYSHLSKSALEKLEILSSEERNPAVGSDDENVAPSDGIEGGENQAIEGDQLSEVTDVSSGSEDIELKEQASESTSQNTSNEQIATEDGAREEADEASAELEEKKDL